MKIIFFANEFFNIYNFRFDLIKKIKIQYPHSKIILAAKFDGYEKKLLTYFENIEVIDSKIESRSLKIKSNVISFLNIFRLVIRCKPNLVISYTIKPNLFLNLIRFFYNFKLLTNITGFGEVYLNKNLINSLLFFFYLKIIIKSDAIICQNKNDMQILCRHNKSFHNKIHFIPGSGVNKNKFKFFRMNDTKKKIKILFVGRIIAEKGIIEFLKAIIKFNKVYPNKFSFMIIGSQYLENQRFNSIFINYLSKSRAHYINYTNKINNYISSTNFVILPSYREGLSKILLESLSIGRPIITTNVPGCSELVNNNYNGYLVKKYSYYDIFNTFKKILKLNIDEIRIMGKNSYLKSKIYTSENINSLYISLIDTTMQK